MIDRIDAMGAKIHVSGITTKPGHLNKELTPYRPPIPNVWAFSLALVHDLDNSLIFGNQYTVANALCTKLNLVHHTEDQLEGTSMNLVYNCPYK